MAVAQEQIACRNGLRQRALRARAAFFVTDNVRHVARICADAFQPEVLRAGNPLGETQCRLTRLNARSVLSDIEINQNRNVDSGGQCCMLKLVDIANIVYHHDRVACLRN